MSAWKSGDVRGGSADVCVMKDVTVRTGMCPYLRFCVDSTLVFCNVVKREAKGKELFSSTDIDESYVVTPTVPMSRWDTL